ncbi:NmrA family NAD(P)-binding protein [Bradyrhizobium murdochi]|uniref:NmrA family NAD(P)-binding protein n=1 Tax=Bradyrhizobium murdochi TaxID=1038859 RepID=UPI0004916648|nr:NmrA family NAD(P)-binding protein [Bradyrhizobium murdochi]
MTENTRKKTFVVVGATGSVGRVVASTLESLGHQVRLVARSLGLPFEHREKLREAFSGVNGAYLMIPFDRAAPDLHRGEDEIGDALAQAVAASGVPRVVLLSGLSAHLNEKIVGSAKGAAMMEQRLDAMNIGELAHLRAGFFMENLLQGVPQMVQTGDFRWAFAGHKPMPMIAAKDIGVRAAEILVAADVGPRVQELHGARDYTMAEAVSILGASIGLPNARYIQVSYEEGRAGMIGAGASPSFADAVMETARGFNEGRVWAKEARSPRNTTETTLDTFAAETLAPAYRAAVERSGRRPIK